MKPFCFANHKFNQGTLETIHVEHIVIICIGIIAVLSPLEEAKYYAIFLPNQRMPNAV